MCAAALCSEFYDSERLGVANVELSENVGMCAGLEEEKGQFHIVLFPSHQPIRLNMALP